MGGVQGFSSVKIGTQRKDFVGTKWALTWKEVDGAKTVDARLVAEGYRGLREPQVVSFAVDIPRSPEEVAALDLGRQGRLSPGGWRSMRVR